MRSNTNKHFILLATFSLCIFFCSCSKKPSGGPPMGGGPGMGFQMPPVEVEVLEVKPGSFVKTINAVGELRSPQTTIITSELMGKITYLNIPEGRAVEKGHIFAKIEDSNDKAGVLVAKAKLKRAKEYYTRMKALNDEGAVSDQDLDDAVEKLNIAKAEFADKGSTLIKNTIKAPFSGKVSLKKVSLGTYLAPGDEIVRLTQTNPLDLIFTLPEKNLSDIRLGQRVTFMVEGSEKNYSGAVKAVDPYINPEDRTVTIKARVSNSSRELLPGRFANIVHEIGRLNNIIQIPQEALVLSGNSTKVFVLNEDKTFEERVVKVGEWNDLSVQITDGVQAGETIITTGYQKLRPGAMIITKPYTPFGKKEVNKVS